MLPAIKFQIGNFSKAAHVLMYSTIYTKSWVVVLDVIQCEQCFELFVEFVIYGEVQIH